VWQAWQVWQPAQVIVLTPKIRHTISHTQRHTNPAGVAIPPKALAMN